MRIAQQLYEGVNIKGQGTVGLITYLRTDSTRISVEADAAAKRIYQGSLWSRVCWSRNCRQEKTTRKVQDAHEAIRPTYMTNSPASIKRRTIKRSVPFISADLEPFHGKPYGTSQIREYICKDRCRRLSF